LCPRRDKKKGKLPKSKLNSKNTFKKKGESRKRSPISSSTLFFYGGTVPSGLTSFPKKKLNSK
jgi:hypothetical protein